MSLIIAGRIASMLFFMLPGYILGKKGFIGGEGAADMGRLLVWFILPCSVIGSFDRDFSRERASLLLAGFVISLLVLLLSAVISRAVFGKESVECFCGAFSNAGFMGIPLVSAVMGGDMVFCAAVFTALLNILQWSWGAFKVCAFRLLIIPIAAVLLAALLPFDSDLKITAVILAAAPAGSNAAVYAQMFNKDHKTAAGLVVISTILSVVSMPAVIQIAGYILQSNPL